MRAKTKKWFSPLFVLTLAIAGIFGVSAAVVNKQIDKNNVLKKVKADVDCIVYCAITDAQREDGITMKANANIGDNNTWRQYTMSDTGNMYTSGGNQYRIFTATLSLKYGGVDALQFQRYEGSTWKSQEQPYGSWTVASTFEGKMYVWSTGWTEYSNKDIKISYYNNDGSSRSHFDYVQKAESISYTIQNFADIGFYSQGLNAFTHWNTQSGDGGTSYDQGDVYTTPSDLNLFFIQASATYQYSKDGGANWVTLTHDGTGGSGYTGQYKADSQTFYTGDKVIIRKYHNSTSNYIESRAVTAGETNYNKDTGIIYCVTGTIYVKVNDTGGTTVYVGGLVDRGIVIVRDGKEYKCPCTPQTTTGQYQEWYVNNIMLLPDDTLKATYQGGASYAITVENTDVYGISSAGAVSTPGVYTIYLKSSDSGENFPTVYLSMEDDASATLIAQKFNEALTTVCNSTVSGGATSQITSAFDTQKDYYDHLTSTCQTKVKSTSSDTDVVAMRAKYDYIIGKYGTTIAPDYMSRNPRSAIREFTPYSLITGDDGDNSSVILIIVASSVAILSITALAVLMVKKKKVANK